MLTKTQLLNFDAGSYRPIIEGWGQAADAVSSASNTISSTGDQMYNWTGPAADQAVTTMGYLVEVVSNAPQLFNEAQDTLGAFVAAVYQQQDILKAALQKASTLSCTVAEDGTVTPPAQPPNEPPQACPPDPTLAAKWAREQEAYYNSPAVQTWQAATQQAPGLQTTIQGALQAATAADSRAARDLQRGIQGGGDVLKIVSGKDPTGSYLENLYADTQSMADGHRWMEQYVHEAATLLPKAANGDQAAVAQLAQLTPLSWDQDFGASLMNQLGASGLENLPIEMGQKLQDMWDGQSTGMPAVFAGDQTVLHFLGDSLASASNSSNLSPGFIQGLLNDKSAFAVAARNAGPAGFWALGQILGASTGAVQYNSQFLDTVGTAIIHFDQHQDATFGYEGIGPFSYMYANNLNLPLNADPEASFHGITDSGGDPIYGLMHAAQISPAAAQTLFSSNGNLNIVLTQLPWNYDQGSALGAALQAATTGPGTVSATLTSNIVHIMAGQYQNDSGYAAQMSGLDPHVAQILAEPQNLMAINQAVGEGVQNTPGTAYHYAPLDGPGGWGPSFKTGDLAEVLGFLGQSPSSYSILQNAEAHYMADNLNQAVATAMAHGGLSNVQDNSGIQHALTEGMTVLGFMGSVKAIVAQNGADASAAATIRDLTEGSAGASAVAAVTAAVPEVSIPFGLISSALAAIGANVQPSTAPTAAWDRQEVSLPTFGTIALAGALLKNHAYPPSDYGNPAGQFWDPKTGQLLPTKDLDQTQIATANTWLEHVPAIGPSTYNQSMINQSVIGALTGQNNLGG